MDFSELVERCEEELNSKYARLRPSQQFNIVGDVSMAISEAVSEIQQGCEEDKRACTQLSGLTALVQIVRDMLECPHNEIRKGLMHDIDSIGDTIGGIFEGMPDEDKAAQLAEIQKLAQELSGYGIESLSENLGLDQFDESADESDEV